MNKQTFTVIAGQNLSGNSLFGDNFKVVSELYNVIVAKNEWV